MALAYAREWTFAGGSGTHVAAGITDEFIRLYTAGEQAKILKLMRIMLLANYCGNAYYKRPWKDEPVQTVCYIGLNESKPED